MQQRIFLEEPVLFRSDLIGRRIVWPSLIGSLAAHAVVLALAILTAGHASWFQIEYTDWSAYAEPIRLRIPEPIYYQARGARRASQGRTGRPPGDTAGPNAGLARGSSLSHWLPPPPNLELPMPRQIPAEAPIILQPDPRAPRALPKLDLSFLAAWGRLEPDSRKLTSHEPVVPGRTEGPAPPPKLGETPVLAIPNREPRAADVNIAAAPPQPTPALAMPSPATIPVRLKEKTAEAPLASFDVTQGRQVNVFALEASRKYPGEMVEIPRGLENSPPPRRGEGGGGNASGNASGDGAVSAPSSDRGVANTSTASTGQKRGSGEPGESATGSVSPSGKSPGTGTLQSMNSTDSGASREADSPAVTRIQHPADGNYDVVLMNSAGLDDLPEVAGLLTGNPVYTVYLRVGDRREWLLEYLACRPMQARTPGRTR